MQDHALHFCHFSVVFAAIFIPDRINAIAEYKFARPSPKEKGLLRITRNSPF